MSVCSKPGCQKEGLHFCAACGKERYCSKECQKTHWKKHKLECQRVEGMTRFKFIKSAKLGGTQITFGYEQSNIPLRAKNEFEAAVAAVEAAGIMPPDLEETGQTVIKVSPARYDVPFLATLWLQETSYKDNAPPELLRVQDLATQLTGGAANMLHVFLQKCHHSLLPTMNCKCKGLEDMDLAVSELTKKYLQEGPERSQNQRWIALTVNQLLYLYSKCCKLELHLIERVSAISERLRSEHEWPGHTEELSKLQSQVQATDFYKNSADSLEFLTELVRRSQQPCEQTILTLPADILNDTLAEICNGNGDMIKCWPGQLHSKLVELKRSGGDVIRVPPAKWHEHVEMVLKTLATRFLSRSSSPVSARNGDSQGNRVHSSSGNEVFSIIHAVRMDGNVPFVEYQMHGQSEWQPITLLQNWAALRKLKNESSPASMEDEDDREEKVSKGDDYVVGTLSIHEQDCLQATAHWNAHILMSSALESIGAILNDENALDPSKAEEMIYDTLIEAVSLHRISSLMHHVTWITTAP